MNKLRVGVIGCGRTAIENFLPTLLEQSHEVEVSALCDIVEARANWCKKSFPAAAVYINYRKMLQETSLDGVILAVQVTVQAPVLENVLSYGVPVLVEGPLKLSQRDMVRLEQTGKLQLVHIIYEGNIAPMMKQLRQHSAKAV